MTMNKQKILCEFDNILDQIIRIHESLQGKYSPCNVLDDVALLLNRLQKLSKQKNKLSLDDSELDTIYSNMGKCYEYIERIHDIVRKYLKDLEEQHTYK